MFADITRYPRFFRLLPIAEEFANGFAAVIKEFNWKRVAVIAYADAFMLKVKMLYMPCVTIYDKMR